MPELRPYQRAVVDTAPSRFLYADPPGTGKTATALRWASAHGSQHALVVAPKAVLHHWEAEAARWVSTSSPVTGVGTPPVRARLRSQAYCTPGSILIVNYETMRQDIAALCECRFDTVIFDEAHRLKGRETQVHKAALKLARRAPRLALVTGTPILNRADEMWSALHLLDPKRWPSYWRWVEEHFRISATTFGGRISRPARLIQGPLPGALDRIREEAAEFLFQRPLEELLPDLPEVTETHIEVDLTGAERRAYNTMAAKAWAEIGYDVVVAPNAVTKITRLRQLAAGWGAEPTEVGSKIAAAVELAEDLAPEQVVILTAHRLTAQRIAQAVGADIYIGSMPTSERADAVESFRLGFNRVIVGTFGAMSEGVDGLQVARHIVLVDRDWTPARNEQAIARIRRSGQAHDAINVWHIVARDTIDQYVADALARKQDVIDAIMSHPFDTVTNTRLP